MNTAFLLMAQYGPTPVIPAARVRADYFPDLRLSDLRRHLPVFRIEDSQKAPLIVPLMDLARYIDRGVSASMSPPKPKTAMPSGLIYFVRAGDRVKIGFTTNLHGRLGKLRTGCPVPMEVLHTIPGSITDETHLHWRFSELRENGEWFRYEGALKEYVEGLSG